MRLGLLAFLVTGMIQAQEPAKAAKQPLQLRGDRFRGLAYDEMTAEQKALTDRALAGRGTIGTFNILLRSPGLSEAIRGTAGGRAGSPLTQKLSELAIIINARYWTTQFEWLVHHRAAVQAGISETTVKAIAEGRRPASMPPDEEVVYNFVRELLKTRQVSDPTFAAAKSLLGERGIVDLLGLVGFYQTTSLMMNVDRYPMQGPDQKPELKKLASTLP
jgi:4-carboxymuconolactone decarboxylase